MPHRASLRHSATICHSVAYHAWQVIAFDVDKDSACTECKVFQGPGDVVAAHQKQCTGTKADGFDEDGRAERREMVAPIHAAHELHEMDAPLHKFEHQLKLVVDIGLFFFSLCNAGVKFSEVGAMTVTVLVSLIAGKTLGVVGESEYGLHEFLLLLTL